MSLAFGSWVITSGLARHPAAAPRFVFGQDLWRAARYAARVVQIYDDSCLAGEARDCIARDRARVRLAALREQAGAAATSRPDR